MKTLYVMKHKSKDVFIYDGLHEIELTEIDECTTFETESDANECLNSEGTIFWLNHSCTESINNFEIRSITITLNSPVCDCKCKRNYNPTLDCDMCTGCGKFYDKQAEVKIVSKK